MKSLSIYSEAERLYKLGLAILWLKPHAKNPIESGWTTGPRKPWGYLKETYIDNLNVGARMGSASKIGDHYLACIDVDVKDPNSKKILLAKLKEITKGRKFPEVRSGSGNGSRHLYCLTREPFKMITIFKDKNIGEICIYSDGRQMVLPPSIHPNGKMYTWIKPINKKSDLPVLNIEELKVNGINSRMDHKDTRNMLDNSSVCTFDNIPTFNFSRIDLDWLPDLPNHIRLGIKTGEGVIDRSTFLLPASNALISCGLDTNEILSVLTDPNTYLGKCAYDHAKTKNRKKAAEWVYKYTLARIEQERAPENIFNKIVEERTLSFDEQCAQDQEFEEARNWRQDLERSGAKGEGPPKGNIKNVVLILKNMVGDDVVKRNEFAFRDIYGIDAPWGGFKDKNITDDDVSRIKFWLSTNFDFEPKSTVIYDALTELACQNAFDPVRDQLDALPKWDGKPRLGTWLKDNFEAEGPDEYLDQVFTKWMCAMIRRVYEPGAKFDWMPIFEGSQGAGKSSFGRLLVGDLYFLDWLPNLGDKDSALGLQGHWCVEMGELSQFKRNELETIKAFITRTVDKFRPPHGKKLTDSPRRCVFFGTTNKTTYLIDTTGNRRFKPIVVGRLDFKALHQDRAQLFAEAKFLYETKFNRDLDFELTGDARIFELEIQREKMVEDDSDLMVEALQDFVEKIKKGDIIFDLKKIRILDFFGVAGPLARWPQNSRNVGFCALALKKMGAVKRGIKGLKYWKIDVR